MAFPTMGTPQGVCIAFDDDAMTVSPTWTRIDQDAVVTNWSVDRGRASELEKTSTGTATVTIIDKNGTFDPTNSSGAFFGKLDPMKQAAIALYDPTASTWTTIFRGFVAEWLFELDVTERYFTVTLELVDALDVLARLQLEPGEHGQTPPSGSEGDVYYEGEPEGAQKHVNRRIENALDDVGFPSALQDIFSGNVTVRGKVYDRSDQILSVIQDAVDAEFPGPANFYISKDGYAVFHGRFARFYPGRAQYGITTFKAGDQTAVAGDSTVAPIAPISFRRSENDVINSVLALAFQVDDTTAASLVVKDTGSITTFGYRSENFESLLTYQGHDDAGVTTDSQTETTKFATYYVDNYSDVKTRITELTFRPRPSGSTNASAWWGLVCGVEISDIVNLATTHPGGGGFSEDFFVEGLHYDADTQGGASFTNVTLTLDVSPRAYYDNNPFGSTDGGILSAHLSGSGLMVATGSAA